jgi:hypothetical protein
MNKTLESDSLLSGNAGASSNTPNDLTASNALAKGRFYLFFTRLVTFFVTVLCGMGTIYHLCEVT